MKDRPAWRDLRTGRYVKVVRAEGRVTVYAGGRILSHTRRMPSRIRQTLVPVTAPKVRGPRHPRTGRFITEKEATKLRTMKITDKDIRRIIDQSPKMKRALARVRKGKKARARRAMAFYLKRYLQDVKTQLRRKP